MSAEIASRNFGDEQPAKTTLFAGGLRSVSAEIASCDFGR
jgi:hypothetical protein